MELPTYKEAVRIMGENGLLTLSQDGWAFLQRDHPELANLLFNMSKTNKITTEHVTGIGFILGLMLQTQK